MRLEEELEDFDEDDMTFDSEASMCENWGAWEDEEGDYCDYLTWRYGITFGDK